MKNNGPVSRVLRFALWLPVFVLCLQLMPQSSLADDGPRKVRGISANGHWIDAPDSYRPNSHRHRGSGAWQGPSLYLLELTPGEDYTLGLRYPAALAGKPRITLFDRWPQDSGAKSYKLATGPVVRTSYEKIEYRWRLAVSSRSQGRFAFLLVDPQPGITGSEKPFRYALYLTTPAISPLHQTGEGITYLRGPQDLLLPPGEGGNYVVEYPSIDTYPLEDMWPPSSDEPNLVRNGDFSQGLAGWQLWPEGGEGVGLFEGKLRIWSQDSSAASGIVQKIDAKLPGVDSLKLSLDILITAQAEATGPAGPSPLQLALCYEDTQGATRCGKNAFRLNFALQLDDARTSLPSVVNLPQNEWTHYNLDLGILGLNLRRLINIELSGNGAPRREAWVQNVKISR